MRVQFCVNAFGDLDSFFLICPPVQLSCWFKRCCFYVFDFGDFPWNAEDWDFGDFPGGLYFDPLAQSFEVPTTTGGGVFITSAELYFRTKDVAAPVNFEIRTMANGYPTTDVQRVFKGQARLIKEM